MEYSFSFLVRLAVSQKGQSYLNVGQIIVHECGRPLNVFTYFSLKYDTVYSYLHINH